MTCRLLVQLMLRSSSHELLLDRRRSLPALKVPYRKSRRRLLPALQARHQIVLACFLATFTAYVERVGFSIAYTAMAKEVKVCISCGTIAWVVSRAMALLPRSFSDSMQFLLQSMLQQLPCLDQGNARRNSGV